MTKIVCALLLTLPALFAQAIEGTVVNSVTGAPIGGAQVTVARAGTTVSQTTTDPQGAFRMEGLADGDYRADFTMRGFMPPAHEAAVRRSFRIVAGMDTIRLEAKLTPLGRVSGSVLDPGGHPVAGARTDLLLTGSFVGQSKVTNQQGKFSFDEIPPGTYLLSAQPAATLKPPGPDGDQRLGWVHTWYPGAVNPRDAAKLTVGPGSEISEQDISLRALPVHRLRGIVLGASGEAVAKAPVKAAPSEEVFATDIQTTSARDGSFEFSSLPDGTWRVSTEVEHTRGFTTAQLAGRDIDRIELHLSPPFRISGTLEFEPPQAGPGKGKGKAAGVVLAPEGGGSGLAQAVGHEGKFQIDDVYPGRYTIVVILPGAEYYLASVMLGDRDVLGQTVDLAPSPLPIRIVFKSNGGAVRGTVEDCGDATVVLIPQSDALRDPQFVRSQPCGEGGRFEIGNIRPGDYYAFAFDRVKPLELVDSAFVHSIVNNAVSVQLREGEMKVVDLRLTRPQ